MDLNFSCENLCSKFGYSIRRMNEIKYLVSHYNCPFSRVVERKKNAKSKGKEKTKRK